MDEVYFNHMYAHNVIRNGFGVGNRVGFGVGGGVIKLVGFGVGCTQLKSKIRIVRAI